MGLWGSPRLDGFTGSLQRGDGKGKDIQGLEFTIGYLEGCKFCV